MPNHGRQLKTVELLPTGRQNFQMQNLVTPDSLGLVTFDPLRLRVLPSCDATFLPLLRLVCPVSQVIP
jgi:hypothetical protein